MKIGKLALANLFFVTVASPFSFAQVGTCVGSMDNSKKSPTTRIQELRQVQIETSRELERYRYSRNGNYPMPQNFQPAQMQSLYLAKALNPKASTSMLIAELLRTEESIQREGLEPLPYGSPFGGDHFGRIGELTTRPSRAVYLAAALTGSNTTTAFKRARQGRLLSYEASNRDRQTLSESQETAFYLQSILHPSSSLAANRNQMIEVKDLIDQEANAPGRVTNYGTNVPRGRINPVQELAVYLAIAINPKLNVPEVIHSVRETSLAFIEEARLPRLTDPNAVHDRYAFPETRGFANLQQQLAVLVAAAVNP